MSGELELLEKEYCPPLDPALVQAIFLDFHDLGEERVRKAREILDPIRDSALAEQTTGFDASGCSGNPQSRNDGVSSETGDTTTESGFAHSEGTELTNLSNEIFSIGLVDKKLPQSPSRSGSNSSDSNLQHLESLDNSTKEDRLIETFPTLPQSLIKATLSKSKGNFEKTIDELLNHVYFEGVSSEVGRQDHIPKGIDAFFEDNMIPRNRKRKAKKRKDLNLLVDSSSNIAAETPLSPLSQNRWATARQDIDFLVSRTKMPPATITSLYHKNGATLPGAIKAIAEANMEQVKNEDTQTMAQHAVDLMEDFPAVEYSTALALIRITHPSTAKAHELAKALIGKTQQHSGLHIFPSYAPVILSENSPMPPRLTASLPTSPAPASSSTALTAARNVAFSQASAAYRKGKSQPLMMAAASYYSQIGRDLDVVTKSAISAEADALVDAQSKPTELDLHGVSVKDATRIAKEKVTAWWHNLGEGRIDTKGRAGIGSGYRIITGVGYHSEGGVGKIGPAVGKMLVRDGWKVEFGRGILIVTGVMRKK